jgi:signal transduction histidine kinase
MTNLNILIIEDNEDDVLLIMKELVYGGLTVATYQRVQTETTMLNALNNPTIQWDIIISDYSMPNFDGLKALELLKRSGKDIPFILISGMIGEETAVAALKAGANDYLLKDRLSRLPKAIERELNDAKQRLKLNETQQQLAHAKELADIANQRKSQVLAFVAHEFKNPLQAISLFANLLNEGMHGELNAKQLSSINNIQAATSHLKMIVNDILDIAAIEAGKIKLNLTYVDVVTLIRNATSLLEAQAMEEEIQLKTDFLINTPELFILADENRFKQILINLLSNAIKYSRKNSCVTTKLSLDTGVTQAELECFLV